MNLNDLRGPTDKIFEKTWYFLEPFDWISGHQGIIRRCYHIICHKAFV